MNIQQFKYIVEVEKQGSIRAAAQKLFVAQSTLSTALKDLEAEIGVTLFLRSQKGIIVTNEGAEFLAYAKQVLSQIHIIEDTYIHKSLIEARFSISCQHYDFTAEAFARLIAEISEQEAYQRFTFRLLETDTKKVLQDVHDNQSELGVIYLSHFNQKVMQRLITKLELSFQELCSVQANVFLGKNHPLAHKDRIEPQDLVPYPALSFEQGSDKANYFSEEPLIAQESLRKVFVSDRTTAINLLTSSQCYLIGSGIRSSSLTKSELVSLPLTSQDKYRIGLVFSPQRKLSALGEKYIALLQDVIFG